MNEYFVVDIGWLC